jgi:hypothetical protein
VQGGSFSVQDGGLEVPKESGGWLGGVFSPARTVRTATVTVRGEERMFIRGDANGDLETNISDAVFLLDYLFLGGEVPPCLRSADCNADGTAEITDAIFLLSSLFLGTDRLPPPAPDCGSGSEPDSLSCEASTC